MGRFIEGYDRSQPLLLPACVEDYVSQDSLVRVIDAFVETLDLTALGFERTVSAPTGRPGYHPGDMLRLYIWGYLNQLRSSRQLERACQRDLEAIWLMRRTTPRSEEHTSELQSLMRIPYAVFCWKKKTK